MERAATEHAGDPANNALLALHGTRFSAWLWATFQLGTTARQPHTRAGAPCRWRRSADGPLDAEPVGHAAARPPGCQLRDLEQLPLVGREPGQDLAYQLGSTRASIGHACGQACEQPSTLGLFCGLVSLGSRGRWAKAGRSRPGPPTHGRVADRRCFGEPARLDTAVQSHGQTPDRRH